MVPRDTVPAVAHLRVRIAEDAEELAARGASEFSLRADEAVASRGVFRVALAGGSTPERLYRALAEGSDVAWERTQVFFGDERHVPPDHAESNFRLAYQTLLSRVPIPPANVYRWRSEGADVDGAAAHYETLLREVFGTKAGEAPRFDLVLLGLGEDGHTASLFPGSEALHETRKLAAAPWIEKLGAYRFTLTPQVLNASLHALFLVSGSAKAAVLKRVLEGERLPEELPAQLVDPLEGQLMWLVDQEAASNLRRAAG
jgi:6-phosphogluconolactonase